MEEIQNVTLKLFFHLESKQPYSQVLDPKENDIYKERKWKWMHIY